MAETEAKNKGGIKSPIKAAVTAALLVSFFIFLATISFNDWAIITVAFYSLALWPIAALLSVVISIICNKRTSSNFIFVPYLSSLLSTGLFALTLILFFLKSINDPSIIIVIAILASILTLTSWISLAVLMRKFPGRWGIQTSVVTCICLVLLLHLPALLLGGFVARPIRAEIHIKFAAKPIIASLEIYHREHMKYPEDIKALNLPSESVDTLFGFYHRSYDDNDYYYLSFNWPMFNGLNYVYDSNTHTWSFEAISR